MAFKKLFFIVAVFFISPLFSFAQSTDLATLVQQLQQQVLELQKRIQTLQQQLSETRSELGVQQTPVIKIEAEDDDEENEDRKEIPEFTKTLSRGSSGDDVRKLQEFLKKDKAIYPDGLITGYFGPKTEEALKRWQKKHNIEQVGILGPQTRARFQELGRGVIQGLLQQGAGVSGIIPPGLEKKFEVTATTTTTATTSPSIATTTPAKPLPRPGTCAASNAYCINGDECSKNGYYWCRNSCYATSTACLGQTFVPPVQPAVPATPAQPTSQTSTTTMPVTQVVSAIVATSTVSSSSLSPEISTLTDYLNWGGNYALLDPFLVYYGILVKAPVSYTSYSIQTSFNVYIKEPADINFKKYSFTKSPFSIYNSVAQWMFDINLQVTNTSQYLGKYDHYVAMLDSNGNEISKTAITSGYLYPPPIISPADGSTVSSGFQITILNNPQNNSNPQYQIQLFDKNNRLVWSTQTSQSNFSYSGPALSLSYSPYRLFVNTNAGFKPQEYAYPAVSKFYFSTTEDITPPTISNISVSSTASTVDVTWLTNEASDSQLQFGLSTAYGSHSIFTSLVTSHWVGLSQLPPLTTYHFRVKSKDAAGNIGISNDSTFTTSFAATDTQAPSVPTSLTATSSQYSVALNWNQSTDNVGVVGYKIYRNGEERYNVNALSHTDWAVSPGVTYSYTVTAYDNVGNVSAQSSPVSVTTLTTTTATTTGINLDTTSRLAQILESLKSLVDNLQSISR